MHTERIATRSVSCGSFLLAVVMLTLLVGCRDSDPLVLASTTSTEDSGLFDELIPAFEAAHPDYEVAVVAVGSGQALEIARRGDADVLLAHAPAAESAFVAAGHATERVEVMYNDFVIVGPSHDPAGVRGGSDAIAAFRAISTSNAPFTSRADNSGTHLKEREIWAAAGIEPGGDAYMEAGIGMADLLLVAAERRAYTLTDRATFLSLRERLDLEIVVEGDPRLYNQYAVLPVANARNAAGARAFRNWITSPDAQALIGSYGIDRFGEPLFTPNAQDTAARPGLEGWNRRGGRP